MFEKKSMIENYNVSLAVSYMEIYKDEVYDLLVTRENVCLLSRSSSSNVDMVTGSQASCSRKRRWHGLRGKPHFRASIFGGRF